MTRKILRWIIRQLFFLLSQVEVEGLDRIPSQGAFILVVNHLSQLDPPLIMMLVERDDLTGWVAEKYQKNVAVSWLVKVMHGIWLNRGEADRNALRQAVEYLKAGGCLGIAPEGTRSPTGALIEGKTGAAYLAEKTGVLVIPAAITGTQTAIRDLKLLRRPRIGVHIGLPFHLPPVDRAARAEELQRNADEIMCRIAALLPPEYRGVYADHPRLLKLLSKGADVNCSESLTDVMKCR